MKDKFLHLSLGGLFAACVAFAQPSTPLAFEVATVKPSAPLDMAALRNGKAHIGTRLDAARLDIGSATLSRLICSAYRLKPYQVSGPEWLKNTMFDIQATLPHGATAAQVPDMLQTLLAERFGLKVHRDSKEQPVYALVVAKGAKLTESAPDPAPPPAPVDAPQPESKGRPESIAFPTAQGDVKLTRSGEGINLEMPGGEITGKVRASVVRSGPSPTIHLESSATTMKSFAAMLSVGIVDRPVVDQTGLTGNYEIAVDISGDDAINVARASVSFLPMGGGGGGEGRHEGGTAPGGASDPSGSSIFSSLQKLGLKLEPRKLPLDTLVIDHIEKTPTEN